MSITPLAYGLLKIGGPQAKAFLQGQLTCDMEKIVDANLTLAAHCSPQGRVLSLFQVCYLDSYYYLLLPQALISITLSALMKYAAFYKISITDASAEMNHLKNSFPDLAVLHANHINAGIPTLYPSTTNKFLPHELNLHLLNAISFDKGCYTGQEIIARMHYRGKLKNHLYKAKLTTSSKPQPGNAIAISAHQLCGSVVDVYQPPGMHDHYQLLILCDENNAKQSQLFIQSNQQDYIIVEHD